MITLTSSDATELHAANTVSRIRWELLHATDMLDALHTGLWLRRRHVLQEALWIIGQFTCMTLYM